MELFFAEFQSSRHVSKLNQLQSLMEFCRKIKTPIFITPSDVQATFSSRASLSCYFFFIISIHTTIHISLSLSLSLNPSVCMNILLKKINWRFFSRDKYMRICSNAAEGKSYTSKAISRSQFWECVLEASSSKTILVHLEIWFTNCPVELV